MLGWLERLGEAMVEAVVEAVVEDVEEAVLEAVEDGGGEAVTSTAGSCRPLAPGLAVTTPPSSLPGLESLRQISTILTQSMVISSSSPGDLDWIDWAELLAFW